MTASAGPGRPRRVSVMGNSGSGKTTTAAALAAALEVPHVELDAIHHLEDWEPIARDEFRRQVGAICATDGWVIDGNYSAVRDLVLARADTVVFLDLPRPQVMRQVIRRSLRRSVSGEELWNGNRENWRNLVRLDERENIVLWAWRRHDKYRHRYLEIATDPELAHLRTLRLRSHDEIRRMLVTLAGGRAG